MSSAKLVRGLRSQIVDQLRNDLLSGRIEPGRYLRQEELVARFGVSRTPVREALIQLTNEGLLEAVPNMGAKVRSQPPDHIQEFLTPLRRTIEVYALQLCFDSLNADDFKLWEEILGRLHQACMQRDYASMVAAEIDFHRSILVRANDPTLLAIWGLVLSQVVALFRAAHVKYDDPMDIYREHAGIVAKFRTGTKQEAIAHYSQQIGAPIPNRRRVPKSSKNPRGNKSSNG